MCGRYSRVRVCVRCPARGRCTERGAGSDSAAPEGGLCRCGGGGRGENPARRWRRRRPRALWPHRHHARCSACAVPPSPGAYRRPGPAATRWADSRLLSRLRRSPHTSRSDTDGFAEPDLPVLLPSSTHPPSGLHTTVLYVVHMATELQSCQELPGTHGTLWCKVNVIMSLDPMECADA